MKLVDDANAMRTSLHGTLESRAVELKKPKGWADRFFRHSIRVTAPAAPAAPAAATGK